MSSLMVRAARAAEGPLLTSICTDRRLDAARGGAKVSPDPMGSDVFVFRTYLMHHAGAQLAWCHCMLAALL